MGCHWLSWVGGLIFTAQSAREIEVREQNKSLTLKGLIEVADKLDLRFVYGFVPKESSLEKMIEKRTNQVPMKL